MTYFYLPMLMKQILLLFIFCLGLVQASFAQTSGLQLKSRRFIPEANVDQFRWDQFSQKNNAASGQWFALIQFHQLPNVQNRLQMALLGIEPAVYIHANTYYCSLKQPVSNVQLKQLGVRAVIDLQAADKMSAALQKGNYPAWAVKKPGMVDVLVSIHPHLPLATAIHLLQPTHAVLLDTVYHQFHQLQLRVNQDAITSMAALPWLLYIQPILPNPTIINDEMLGMGRTRQAKASLLKGGEGLSGNGVVVGVGDNADITGHEDFKDRVLNYASWSKQTHGTHVAGTIGGAGLVDPLYEGNAPKATLLAQIFAGVWLNAPTYVAAHDMVLTNNSYGAVLGDCDYAGVYDMYSAALDRQAIQLPQLLNIFAAGNDGTLSCNGYPQGYKTTAGGYQAAKNVLTVGWGDKTFNASSSGSKGPVTDGRIKPEIIATGSEVASTAPDNNYHTDWGSSMATPAVTGAASLLIEKYRQLQAGNNPSAALVKTLLMNGATDLGSTGPDYATGFGYLNLYRSLQMLKNNHIIYGSAALGQINNHNITVPVGTAQLKVMLYWVDTPAAVFSQTALVNNLDLLVRTPSANAILPWVLDPAVAGVLNPATRGIDYLNNVEQVTIQNPETGLFTLRVSGTAVTQGNNQAYVLVYDIIEPGVKLGYPNGGEPLVPGETLTIQWDAWGNSTNSFTLQFSNNNGVSWSDIATNLPFATRQYNWMVPAIATENARIRLIWNGTPYSETGQAFVILGQPVIGIPALSSFCKGYYTIEWPAIGGATDYELLLKQGDHFVTKGITTQTSFTYGPLASDSFYIFTVRARINGQIGRRAIAWGDAPSGGTCTTTNGYSNHDFRLESIQPKLSGRLHSSTAFTANETLVFKARYLGQAQSGTAQFAYRVNGGSWINACTVSNIAYDSVISCNVPSIDLLAAGIYTIQAAITSALDPSRLNDTLTVVVQQLPNAPITAAFTEGFENAISGTVAQATRGLPGLNRWDFEGSGVHSRVRNGVPGITALQGSKALTLDANQYIPAGTSSFITGTYNLSNYSGMLPDELGARFRFWYKNHGTTPHADNRVWLRKNDTANWVEVFNFDAVSSKAGSWNQSTVLHVDDYPALFPLSSSVQIRFGNRSIIHTGDDLGNNGLTIDSIGFFFAPQDCEMIAVDTPYIFSCGLGNQVPLRIRAKSYRLSLPSFPVKYRLNGGAIETGIYTNGAPHYIFPQTLDLSAPGDYTLEVWCDWMQDNYRENDTIRVSIKNQPLISSFPYLENFEAGTGYWFTPNSNVFEWGTPASRHIKKAASGSKAWKTKLVGSYNDAEVVYLNSPCFNISGLTNPYFSCNLSYDIEQCSDPNYFCDGAWVEYSLDGSTWSKLSTYNASGVTNGYNNPYFSLWDGSFTRWHTVSMPLPAGASSLQLRFVLESDGGVFKEGLAVDDVHIYDLLQPLYTGALAAPITQPVSGNNWASYQHSSGAVTAQINALGNNLGNTVVQNFVHAGTVRDTNNQYYLNRNWTIKPTNRTSTAQVQFYFTDAEIQAMANANTCATCTPPQDAYDLGVTVYQNTVNASLENSSLADNGGGWHYFYPAAELLKVPYDKGYYAQLNSSFYGEFWLHTGGANQQPLPAQIVQFTAIQKASDALLQWQTANENGVQNYELQVCKGIDAYRNLQFQTLASLPAKNQLANSYQYIDIEAQKNGIRYYRLKITDKNGAVAYSMVRSLQFGKTGEWLVYPNPVKDYVHLQYQGSATWLQASVTNNAGTVLLTKQWQMVNGLQKQTLSIASLPAGTYWLQLFNGQDIQRFLIVKQ
jgi:hypothetical protein